MVIFYDTELYHLQIHDQRNLEDVFPLGFSHLSSSQHPASRSGMAASGNCAKNGPWRVAVGHLWEEHQKMNRSNISSIIAVILSASFTI